MPNEKPHVLVVEDDTLISMSYMAVNNAPSLPFSIHLCKNGADAIAYIKKTSEESSQKIWLTISDYHLGEGPNGIDVCNEAITAQIRRVVMNSMSPNMITENIPPEVDVKSTKLDPDQLRQAILGKLAEDFPGLKHPDLPL